VTIKFTITGGREKCIKKQKEFLCMLLGIFFVLGFSGTAKVSAAQGVLAHETLHMYAGASVDMDEEISDPTYRIPKK